MLFVIWGYCEEPVKSPNTLVKIVESYFLLAVLSNIVQQQILVKSFLQASKEFSDSIKTVVLKVRKFPWIVTKHFKEILAMSPRCTFYMSRPMQL